MKLIYKKIVSFLVLMLIFAAVPSAMATEPTITYKDASNEFVITPDVNDLFQNFKDVMPGDIITQDIKIQNKLSKNTKVKIYLKAEIVDEKYKDFLSQVEVKIIQDNNKMLFNDSGEKRGNLADNICLGTFYSGQKTSLEIQLTVPMSLSNDYQNDIGAVNWVFSAEEFALDPDDPKTGDDSNLIIYVILAFICIAALALLLIFRKKITIK